MRIVTFRAIKEYSEKVPKAKTALEEWYHKTRKAEWENFRDMKQTFNTVDHAGNNRFVFNIKGKSLSAYSHCDLCFSKGVYPVHWHPFGI